MTDDTSDFAISADTLASLRTDEDIVAYLNAAVEIAADLNDPTVVVYAAKVVTEARQRIHR